MSEIQGVDSIGTPTETGVILALPPNPAGQSIARMVHNDDGSVTIFYTEKVEHSETEHEHVTVGHGVEDGQYKRIIRCACGDEQVVGITKEEHDNPPHTHEFACTTCGAGMETL